MLSQRNMDKKCCKGSEKSSKFYKGFRKIRKAALPFLQGDIIFLKERENSEGKEYADNVDPPGIRRPDTGIKKKRKVSRNCSLVRTGSTAYDFPADELG